MPPDEQDKRCSSKNIASLFEPIRNSILSDGQVKCFFSVILRFTVCAKMIAAMQAE
jgi:hypothetical protein